MGPTAAVIIAAAEVFISYPLHLLTSVFWFVSNVQSIRQAYRVNSKSVRLSTGVCGSAASYNPELTTPFHDMDPELRG